MFSEFSTTDKVRTIVSQRLNGVPVTQIAKALGISRQYVYTRIAKFPKGNTTKNNDNPFSEEEALDLAMEYLKRYPTKKHISKHKLTNVEDTIIREMATYHNCSKSDLLNLFYRITEHHPTVPGSTYYSAVDTWRAKNAVTLRELASICNCSLGHIRGILKGWYHLPLSAAKAIKRYSGLSITDIYSDLIELSSNVASQPDPERGDLHG